MPRIVEYVAGKRYAAMTLYNMMRRFRNWPTVWTCYRRRLPLPPLQFREGFILHHGPWDDPLLLVNDIYAKNTYERHLPSELRGVMIDIGANIGLVTLEFAARWKGLCIHAYEPNRPTNEILRKNVATSGFERRVTVYDEAVGGSEGALQLWTNVPSMTATGHSQAPPAPGGVSVQVPMIDLNLAVRRTGAGVIPLLKIDAEGAEATVLENASTSTLAAIECVALEYHEWLCEDALKRCRSVLENANFQTEVTPSDRPDMGMLYAWRQ